MIPKVLISSKSDFWNTPKDIYNYLINEMKLKDLNPSNSKVNCFYEDIKGVDLFCNPPFSQINLFISYCVNYVEWNDNLVFLLLPSTKFDGKAYHQMFNYSKGIYYMIKGRLSYNDSKPAPFGSMLVILCNRLDHNYISSITKEELLITDFRVDLKKYCRQL